jgi:predicted nuclease of predicted toxin-antitoxin system
MKFLADQDVYQVTIKFLRDSGYDVVRAQNVGLSMASDYSILAWANQNKRILITRDHGFGALVFLLRYPNYGVVFLRITPYTVEVCHKELLTFLKKHSDLDLHRRFCVIEPGRHRIR